MVNGWDRHQPDYTPPREPALRREKAFAVAAGILAFVIVVFLGTLAKSDGMPRPWCAGCGMHGGADLWRDLTTKRCVTKEFCLRNERECRYEGCRQLPPPPADAPRTPGKPQIG